MGSYSEQGQSATIIQNNTKFQGPQYATDIPCAYELYISGGLCYAMVSPTVGLASVAPNANADVVINACIVNMTAGGKIYFHAGIYTINASISVPNNLNFIFEGEGIPTFNKFSGATTYNTPTDGTQLRATVAGFNTAGANIGIFTIAPTAATTRGGDITWRDMALMPAWGVVSGSTYVYGISCTASEGPTRIRFEGNVMIIPWGWTEAGMTNGVNSYQFSSCNLSMGGNGDSIDADNLMIAGMWENNGVYGCDFINFRRLFVYRCKQGPQIQASTGCTIGELGIYDMPSVSMRMNAATNGSALINRINRIFVEGPQVSATNFITLPTSGVVPMLQIDQVYLYSNISALTTGITNVDSTALLYPCLVYTATPGTGQVKTYPPPSGLATPFGGTITNPFIGTSIGTGGSASTPTTTVTYVANEPVDVTIAAGTAQTILTKDNYGNTIDNSVATLTHRLLLQNYTIKVIATGVGATTVVQATVGNIQLIVGTTATAQTSVNYVVQKRLTLTNSVATGTTTILDGTTNTGGNTLESALAVPIYRCLEPGEIIQFGTAAPVAGASGTVIQT